MGPLAAAAGHFLPSEIKPSISLSNPKSSVFLRRRVPNYRNNQALVTVARLFGPAIFESSKLKVLFLGVEEKKHPGHLPWIYTLNLSDVTSKLTVAIYRSINNSQIDALKMSKWPLDHSCYPFAWHFDHSVHFLFGIINHDDQEKRLPEENTKLMVDKCGIQQNCIPIRNGGEDDVDEEEEDCESRTHTTEVETE